MATKRATKARAAVSPRKSRSESKEDTQVASADGTGTLPGIWSRLGIQRQGTRARRTTSKSKTDVWRALAERLDPAKFRPKLAPDIEIKRFETKRGPYVMIANPRDLIHFRLETNDAELLDLMDGTRTVEEIVVERLHETGDFDFSGIADVVTTLYQGNVFEQRYIDVDTALTKALGGSTIRHKLRIFARTLTIEWYGPQKFVKWMYDHGLRWLMTPVGLAISFVIASAGFVAFIEVVHKKDFVFAGSALALEGLIILALNYFLTFTHELGHAIVIVKHGRRIKSAGFQIYFGSPAWFVDSSDGLMMERSKRISQSIAGPVAELVLAGIASIIILAFPHIRVGHVLYKFVVLNYFLVFLNLIPLLELDGYHILSEIMEMPDLRSRSLSFVRHDLLRKVLKREQFSAGDAGFTAYGIIGIAFTIFSFIIGGLYWKQLFGGFVAALWRHGLATRLILLILGLFVGGPLIRGMISLWRLLVRKIRGYVRDLRFRFETSWRIEAAELIEALPMFDDIPEETLSDLAGRVRLRSFSPNQVIVRQGERAEAFFVVRAGRLEVFETDPRTGREGSLRILGRGESFGELAIAESSPRTASVRALEPSELFEIDRSTFQRLLADMANVEHFAPSFQQMAELGELESFKHLEPDDLAELVRYGEWRTFAPGDTIVRQGEEGDSFFALKSGQVDVLKGRKLLSTLGPGAHFGEIALLLHTERSATVRARTPVRAYRLERKGFDRLLKDAFKKGTLNPNVPADQLWSH